MVVPLNEACGSRERSSAARGLLTCMLVHLPQGRLIAHGGQGLHSRAIMKLFTQVLIV